MTEEEIKSAIVKIEVKDGQDLETGNGFFIAPGWILTCFHILEGHPSQNIRVVGMQGEIKLEEIEDNPKVIPEVDLALLAVSHKDLPSLELMRKSPSSSTTGINNFTMRSFGGNSTSLTFDGIDDKGGQILIKFSMAEIKKGDSGSPVLGKTDHKVYGVMMRNRTPNQPHGGKAIRVEDIWAAFPEVLELGKITIDNKYVFPKQEWLIKIEEAKSFIDKASVSPFQCTLAITLLKPIKDTLTASSHNFRDYWIADFVGKADVLLENIISQLEDIKKENFSRPNTRRALLQNFYRLKKHIDNY